jgi:SAM-dependent methyltransferase
VLEPAVGTGRSIIPLLEAGLEAEGYDSSPEMLALCRAHCAERDLDPVLHDGDMTSFVDEQRYAAVIVPTDSITLLTGRQALVDALGCFRECLAPGGRLIVDVPAPQLLGGAGGDAILELGGLGSGRLRRCRSTMMRRRIRRCGGFGMRSGATAHLRRPSCSSFAYSIGASRSSRRCWTNLASASPR